MKSICLKKQYEQMYELFMDLFFNGSNFNKNNAELRLVQFDGVVAENQQHMLLTIGTNSFQ